MTAAIQADRLVISRVEPAACASSCAEGPSWSAAHLAHAPEWATIVHRAYGHTPLYLSADAPSGPAGMLPAFIVRRPWFGTIVTSMPFLDGGGPCGATADVSRRLVERVIEEARLVGALVVELRCAERLDVPCEPQQHKVNLVLPLPDDPNELWKQLDGSVRNQVRKAERAGLTIEQDADLEEFYAIFAERMRDLGSPVHSIGFLRAMLDVFGDRARLVSVRKDGHPIGGLIAIAHGDTVTVPWAACLHAHFALCPNMLLYWDTIRAACLHGARRFDFGRSTRGAGTYRFKRQWGAVERPLFWYRLPIGASRAAPADDRHDHAANLVRMWRRLPLTLTRCVGPYFRKYLVQ